MYEEDEKDVDGEKEDAAGGAPVFMVMGEESANPKDEWASLRSEEGEGGR